MNRTIRFRGKSKKGFIEGGYFYDGIDNIHYIGQWKETPPERETGHRDLIHEWVEVDEETVGQFTGLKDKNEKKIFEGDILSLDKIANLYQKCPITILGVVVYYTNGKLGADTKKVINKNFLTPSIHFGLDVMDWIHLQEFDKSEVIGNVFDNPELIK